MTHTVQQGTYYSSLEVDTTYPGKSYNLGTLFGYESEALTALQ